MARRNRSGHYAKPPVTTGKILLWTGELKKGFTRKVERLRLTITNKVDYFKYNQGKRPMLGINNKVIEITMKHVGKYLDKLTKT